MSRLQTKCVFASMGAHLLLLAILIVSSAFVKPPANQETVRFVKIFRDSQVTDAETQGGGNPNVSTEITPPPVAPAQPAVQLPDPPKAEPPPKKQEPKKQEPKKTEPPKPEPKKTEPTKVVKNQNSPVIVPKANLVDKPDAKKIEVNLDVVKKATSDPEIQRKKLERERAAKEERDRQEREYQAQVRAQIDAIESAKRERRELVAAVSGAAGKMDTALSRTTNVEMPGPGGEAFINYADLIYTRYYRAWQTPEGKDVRNPVKVEIVVARDGRVISSRIIRTSGDSQLDGSVRQALDRVTKLPAFPEGAKDVERTFRINFELKSKRQFG